jgi:hypothetical protein
MFDRSLDYYLKDAQSPLDSLYEARPGPEGARGSVHALQGVPVRVERGWIKDLWEAFRVNTAEPFPPSLRLNRSRVHGRYGGMRMRGMMVEKSALAVMDEAEGAPPMMAKAESLGAAEFKSMDTAANSAGGAAPRPSAQAKVRTDFSETAFFKPHIRIENGKGSFSFTAPEQLTGWRILGQALTRDMKVGRFSAESVTRKDLMVRVDMPRFFREGDLGTLQAVVHNESDEELSGELTLSVSEEGRPAEERLGLKELIRPFSVRPHSLAAFAWKVSVPSGVADFKVRVVARSGEKTDAEERDLPVLPSRQRLIESAVTALNGDAQKILSLKVLGIRMPPGTASSWSSAWTHSSCLRSLIPCRFLSNIRTSAWSRL